MKAPLLLAVGLLLVVGCLGASDEKPAKSEPAKSVESSGVVHKASEPYLRRTVLPAFAGAIRGDERNNSGLRAKASFDGRVVVAQMQISLDPNASRV